MNGRIFRLDIPAHQAVQELLPWYVSAQLAPQEAARVQEHLHGCEECRHEAELAGRMRELEPDAPHGLDVDRALTRMLSMLGEQEPAASMTTAALPPAAPAAAQAWTPQRAANQPSWMRWAMAAQAVAIAGLVALLVRPAADNANYHVLGSGAVLSGNLVVVFKPETAEKELRRVLLANGARVVDGPTDTDAYLLNVPLATRDHALLSLRAEPSVMLVESLQAQASPRTRRPPGPTRGRAARAPCYAPARGSPCAHGLRSAPRPARPCRQQRRYRHRPWPGRPTPPTTPRMPSARPTHRPATPRRPNTPCW